MSSKHEEEADLQDEEFEEEYELGDEELEDEELAEEDFIEEEEYQFADDDMFGDSATPTKAKKQEFKVLDAESLINSQQEQVIHVAEVLDIPVSASGAILRSYKWNKEKLFQDFVDSKEKVLKKANISLDDFVFHHGEKPMTCSVCYDDYKGQDMLSLSCKHFLCKFCWKDYLTVSIDDGPSCLQTKCPYPQCPKIVDETLVKEQVDPSKYKLYSKYLARSFVDDNPRIRWCPAPDCGKAVYCHENVTEVVQCSCGMKFCFKCQREHHQPCSCDELTAWLKKEKDESETATWLTANTKDCPKCRRSIEKNGGCNHMTCSLCKYEFCWVCMDEWAKHGSQTGGYYKCNRYKPEELREKLGEDSKENARLALEKYMHYYKRYANHDRSQKFEKQLREKAEEKMKELQLINKYSSWVDVEYIQKGVDTLIECRRSLKFTYVYGYYLKTSPEKDLFEYLQEDLERVTEKLSEILEGPVEKFNRDEIITTTRSAERRLDHLIRGCASGLTQAQA